MMRDRAEVVGEYQKVICLCELNTKLGSSVTCWICKGYISFIENPTHEPEAYSSSVIEWSHLSLINSYEFLLGDTRPIITDNDRSGGFVSSKLNIHGRLF